MGVTAVRSAVSSKLTGYNAYAIQPTSPKSPAAIVGFPQVDYTTSYGGLRRYTLQVSVLVSMQDEIKAQEFLASAVDGMPDLLEVEDAGWRNISVVSATTPFEVVVGQAKYLGVQIELEIYA